METAIKPEILPKDLLIHLVKTEEPHKKAAEVAGQIAKRIVILPPPSTPSLGLGQLMANRQKQALQQTITFRGII